MIKVKLFKQVISFIEGAPITVDEQINEWVEDTGHEILDVALTSNFSDDDIREVIYALVRYKENPDLINENEEDDNEEGVVDIEIEEEVIILA